MAFIIRYFYAPLFFIGFISLAIWCIANELNELWLIPILLIAIATSFVCERALPFEPMWNQPKADIQRDIIHAIVNEASNSLAISLIPIILILLPFDGIWPRSWPLIIQLLMAILIADFGITLMHYLSHKVAILWRFHAVHHSVERLYGFNGLMKHPLHQNLELLAGTTPLILLGLPYEIGALLAFSIIIQLLLQHSNVDIKVGRLGYVWAIAPGHRHHHIASKTQGNVNFGLFTMLWDHMLGTFVINRPQPREGELGIFEYTNYPKRYVAQLIHPFVKR